MTHLRAGAATEAEQGRAGVWEIMAPKDEKQSWKEIWDFPGTYDLGT